MRSKFNIENPWLKLADKYYNYDSPEVFTTLDGKYHSCFEDNIDKYDNEIKESFKDICDNIEEYEEYLVDKYELNTCVNEAISQLEEYEHDKRQAYLEGDS